MRELANIADGIQEKTGTSENLYKLGQSRESATEEVTAHFARKHEDELTEKLSESIKKSDLETTKPAQEISKYMKIKYTDRGQYQCKRSIASTLTILNRF